MIYFLYGEDDFRAKQKLAEIRSKFTDDSLGDTNISTFEGESIDIEKIDQAVQSIPFLVSRKLVIIKNIFSEKNKDIQSKLTTYIDKVPKTTILVFFEQETIDKRSGLFKKLIKIAKSKEFTKLEIPQAKAWVRRTVETREGKIDFQAVDKLILATGVDLWRLDNEINKLLAYNKNIRPENIDKLIKAQVNANIFSLIDAIGQKNLKRAVQELRQLIVTGENEIYIHSMIVYQARNLLLIKSLKEKGENLSQIRKKNRSSSFCSSKDL